MEKYDEPVVARLGTKMIAETWTHSASSSSSLLQICLAGPHRSIVDHIVVTCIQFDLCSERRQYASCNFTQDSLANIDHKHHIVNCHARLGYVC